SRECGRFIDSIRVAWSKARRRSPLTMVHLNRKLRSTCATNRAFAWSSASIRHASNSSSKKPRPPRFDVTQATNNSHKSSFHMEKRMETNRRPATKMAGNRNESAWPKNPKSFLDRVSTGSGSDLVGDQHAIFRTILDFIV